MKSNSNHVPERISQSAGKYQVAYNIAETVKEEMGESRTSYDYDYVAVDKVDRATIIDAVIADTYSKDAELALINNELASPGTAEYAAYQALRQHAKEIAAEVLP